MATRKELQFFHNCRKMMGHTAGRETVDAKIWSLNHEFPDGKSLR
jgi:hypothetical protein